MDVLSMVSGFLIDWCTGVVFVFVAATLWTHMMTTTSALQSLVITQIRILQFGNSNIYRWFGLQSSEWMFHRIPRGKN